MLLVEVLLALPDGPAGLVRVVEGRVRRAQSLAHLAPVAGVVDPRELPGDALGRGRVQVEPGQRTGSERSQKMHVSPRMCKASAGHPEVSKSPI